MGLPASPDQRCTLVCRQADLAKRRDLERDVKQASVDIDALKQEVQRLQQQHKQTASQLKAAVQELGVKQQRTEVDRGVPFGAGITSRLCYV